MTLLWKLLRQHISIAQFVGFFFANLLGMFIVLFGFQLYRDVLPIFTQSDSFMKGNNVIVSKRIGMGTTFSGRSNTFSNSEIADLSAQPFVEKAGSITSTNYKVTASMGINGANILNSELFLESLPDEFVQIDSAQWHYTAGQDVVPIILPRSYLTMYNFGFAQSHALPKISDGLVSMINLTLFLSGNGHQAQIKGRVVGFTNQISSILVPQAFMAWSNGLFAPTADASPSRLIVQLHNEADKRIAQYIERNGYETENSNAKAQKTTAFLQLMVLIVVVVGLTISLLSLYILMLSIYLLVQKNAYKLENLLLIGYSPASVSRPYQWLTIGLSFGVLVIAVVAIIFVRSCYMPTLVMLMPQLGDASLMPTIAFGLALFALVSVINALIIRKKIINISKS